jgi:MerR family transcriptional regulator/heat shock protein HspR
MEYDDRTDEPMFVISVAARLVEMHPQTLRYYERAGLLKPTRSSGKIRLYSQREIERLRKIARLTSELGVNLAGVEIILNMRGKMERMQAEIGEFVEYVQREMAKQEEGWRERVSNALVKLPPRHLVKKDS